MNQAIKLFVSYSHDSDEHKEWVKRLCNKFRDNGIDVKLDQWDLKAGEDTANFMETNVKDSDKVLIVCTEKYVEKVNSGKGGAGYEKTIVTQELIENSQSDKFIPLIRQFSDKRKLPNFLSSKFYIDLSQDSKFESETDKLIWQLLEYEPKDKSPLGKPPDPNRVKRDDRKVLLDMNILKSLDQKLEQLGSEVDKIDNFSEDYEGLDIAEDIIYLKRRVLWAQRSLESITSDSSDDVYSNVNSVKYHTTNSGYSITNLYKKYSNMYNVELIKIGESNARKLAMEAVKSITDNIQAIVNEISKITDDLMDKLYKPVQEK